MTMHIELNLRFFCFHKPSHIEWGTQTVTSFLFVFLVFVVVVFPLIRLEKYWNTFSVTSNVLYVHFYLVCYMRAVSSS